MIGHLLPITKFPPPPPVPAGAWFIAAGSTIVGLGWCPTHDGPVPFNADFLCMACEREAVHLVRESCEYRPTS